LLYATTTTSENVTAFIKRSQGEEASKWFDCITVNDIVPAKNWACGNCECYFQQLGDCSDEYLVSEI